MSKKTIDWTRRSPSLLTPSCVTRKEIARKSAARILRGENTMDKATEGLVLV